MKNKEFRPPELVLDKRVGLTVEAFKLLQKEKRKQKKSMARINNDLILERYGPKIQKSTAT